MIQRWELIFQSNHFHQWYLKFDNYCQNLHQNLHFLAFVSFFGFSSSFVGSGNSFTNDGKKSNFGSSNTAFLLHQQGITHGQWSFFWLACCWFQLKLAFKSASRKLSNAFAINTGVACDTACDTLPTSSSVRIILLILA